MLFCNKYATKFGGAVPAFTQPYIESLKSDGKFYPDEGGKKSVPGLYIYAGKKTKTYYVYVGRGKPKEKLGSHPGYTIDKARAEAKIKLGEQADGHDHQAERHQKNVQKATTLGNYLDNVFKAHAEASISGHRQMLAGLTKNFASILQKPMSDITELDLARWRKKRSNVSLETQRRELTNLKSVLNHAVKSKAIPSHQLSHYRVKGTLKEGEGETKIRYLTEGEESRLRAAMGAREARLRQERSNGNKWRSERGRTLLPEIGPLEFADHIKPIVLLALNTGLRRGDLFGLKWEHIDLGRRQIRKIIAKTSHARRKAGKKLEPAVLPLSAEAHAVLTQWKKQADPNTGLVFASSRTGGRITDLKKAFEGVLVAAKIDGFRFHDLRHTFASRLVMAGVDINTVRELMTHADIKMTLVYAHLSPDHKAAALDRAFGGSANGL
jgi:integrase